MTLAHRRHQRLVRLERALAAQITELERALAPGTPERTPPHLKRELLADPHLVAQAVARFLFWRRYLASRAPDREATLLRVWRQLVGRFIWRAARHARAHGHPLPLRDGAQAPAWVWQTLPATSAKRASGDNGDNPDATISSDAADWWAEYGDPEAAAELGADALDLSIDGEALDTYATGDGLPEGELGAWADFAGVAGAVVNLKKLARLVTRGDVAAAGDALSFADVLSLARQYGLSDMQLAQMVDASWNGQALLWSQDSALSAFGTSLGVPAPGLAPSSGDTGGIGGVFDIHDSPMLTYLRDQAGMRITQITDGQRTLITNTLWLGLGGDTRFAPLSVDAAGRLLRQMWDATGQDVTQMSRSRAYMIAATETARAESFGSMVAMYRLGVQATTWSVTAGACQRCIGNGEAGPVPLYQSYPSGVQAPPDHPLCRCALLPYVPDSFDPAQWQSRDAGPLLDALTSGASADLLTWPETGFDQGFFDAVDLPSGLEDLPDIGLMQVAPVVRKRRTPDGPHRWLVEDGGALVAAMHAHTSGVTLAQLSQALSGAAELSAARWLEVARMDVPLSADALHTFADALRPEHLARDAKLRRRVEAADAAYALDLRRRFDAALHAWRASHHDTDKTDKGQE